jgi:hypothetical protein
MRVREERPTLDSEKHIVDVSAHVLRAFPDHTADALSLAVQPVSIVLLQIFTKRYRSQRRPQVVGHGYR